MKNCLCVPTRRLFQLFTLVLAALALCPTAKAATYDTWYGHTDGKWSTDANWTTFQGAYPGSDIYCGLIFDSNGVGRPTNTNDLSGQVFDGMLIYASGYDFRGNAFGITTTVLADYPSGETTIENALSFSTGGGQIEVTQPGSTLNLDGPISVNNITLNITNAGEIYSADAWTSSGNAAMNITGAGTTIFGDDSPFKGTINSGGTVIVQGSLSNAVVNSSGAFYCSTTVGTVNFTGGTFETSDSLFNTGTLTVLSNLTANSSASLTFRLYGSQTGNYDQIAMLSASNTVSLGNCQLQLQPRGTPTVGQTFKIIDKAGTNKVTGTFAGWPEGSKQFVGNAYYQITYAGGDGNDVVLTTTNLTAVWKGGASTPAWSLAGNWQNNVVPSVNYDVLFPAFSGATSMTTSNDLPNLQVNRVIFTGSNYVFTGNSIPIRGGIWNSNISGNNYFYGGITLLADQIWNSPVNQGLIVSNTITGTNALNLNGGFMQLSGVGPGTGQVTISGPSASTIIAFYGTNTHSGPLAVNSGNFFVNGDCSRMSVITVSNATIQGGRQFSSVALQTPGAVFIPSTFASMTSVGTLLFTNGSVSVGIFGTSTYSNNYNRMTVNGPVIITTNSQFALNIQYTAAMGETYRIFTNTGPYAINGYFNGLPEGATVPGSNQLMRISYRGGAGADLTVTAIPAPHIWNAGAGNGFWSIAGNWVSNSPPGAGEGMIFPTFVAGLTPTNDFPAYTTFESLITSNNYTFYGNSVQLTGGFRIDGSSTFNPAIRLAAGQVWNVGNNFVLNGAVDLTTNPVSFAGTGDVVFNNNVTGTTGSVLSLSALNSLTFNGSNNFSGLLRMLGGSLTNNGPQLNSGITLNQANWFAAGTAFLSNNAVAYNGSASNQAQFNGRMVNGSLAVTGGVFTVGATASISNSPTTIGGGTLSVLGQMLNSSITLAGGTLAGTGTVANVTSLGGVIAPGSTTPGRLQTGSLTLNSGTIVQMQIAGSIAGVNYDQLQAFGSISLNNATLQLSLVDQTLNIGDTVLLIDNQGAQAIFGTFAGLPEGTVFPLGLLNVKISYFGGPGNDVSLTVVSKIPRATWTGLANTNDWGTATNWARSTPPLDGDSLYFPALTGNLTNFNSLGSASYATIFLGGSNYLIQAGGVALTGGIIATNPAGTNTVDSVLPGPSSVISNVAGNTLVLTGTFKDSVLNFETAGLVQLLGNLSGGSNVVMAGSGTLQIYNTNQPFHGNMILQSGLTVANTTNSFGYNAANSVSISNGATLVMSAAGEYSSAFFVGGTQHIATAGAVIVDGGGEFAGSNATIVVEAGASLTVNGFISGAGGLDKEGPGDMTLEVTNLYEGPTVVNGGTLSISGLSTNPPAPAISVNNGSTLRGRGPAGPIFVNSGVLAPGFGNLHATIYCHDGISLASLATYRVRLSNVPAGTYDSMVVGGPVVLISPQLQLLMDFRPPIGASYTLIDNDGTDPVVGTFAGLPQNSFYTNGPTAFRVLYNGGTGNDVVLVADHYLSTGITRTWTGAGANALWSNPQNWATNIAPQSGDALYFPPGALQITNQNDYVTNTFFDAITIGGVNYRLTGNIIAVLDGCTATNASGTNTLALPMAILTNMTIRCTAAGATLAFAAPIDNNSRRLFFAGNGTILGLGPVIGLGDLELAGPGVAELRGTNTYTGETKVSGGRLRFQNSPLGQDGGGVVITNSAILELSATTNVTEDFTISGTILFTNAAAFSVQGNFDFPTNQTGTFNVATGAVASVFPSFSHDAGGPVKQGLGDLYVSAGDLQKDVYTGSFAINAGRVIFDSHAKSLASDFGAFVVNSGAMLAATGIVNHVTVNAGGTLAPGLFNGVGVLTVSGGLSFSPGGTLVVDLQGVSPLLDFDTLIVNGTVNLNDATLRVALGYDAVLDSQYQIISNDGTDPVIGTFAGLGEGATFGTTNGTFEITYVGGDGNDVVLTVVSTPPMLKSFARLPNGTMQVTGSGQPGWFVIFEATESLTPPVSWEMLEVEEPDNLGNVTFTDTDTTNHPMRFYRLTAP